MRVHRLTYMIIALIILIGVIYMQRSEGFEDPVPEYCGSAGFGQSPGVIKVFKIKEKDTIRQYTESECAKIDGSKFTNGQCTVVKDGKTIYCSQACKGLNKIPSPPPEECLVDGKLVGITSKEFKINVGKMVTFPDNTFRFYTKKDCDTLNGTHNVSFLTQMSEADRKTFITNHGKGYGFCSGNGLDYSGMCYAEPPSIADVKNKITGLFS